MWEGDRKALRALNDAAVRAWTWQATEYVATLKLAIAVDERDGKRPFCVLLGDPMSDEQVAELLCRALDQYTSPGRRVGEHGQATKETPEGHAADAVVP